MCSLNPSPTTPQPVTPTSPLHRDRALPTTGSSPARSVGIARVSYPDSATAPTPGRALPGYAPSPPLSSETANAVAWARLQLWRHLAVASSLGPGEPWCGYCGGDAPCGPYRDAEELLALAHGAPPRSIRSARRTPALPTWDGKHGDPTPWDGDVRGRPRPQPTPPPPPKPQK
jgi:hypothetical protein